MSNPLAVFRKYEKILLAVFGVALMIVFTVGGIVSQYMGRSAAQANNPVAVKMKSGDLRESDLQNLRTARYVIRNFMQTINMMAAEKGATPPQSLEIPNTMDESNLVQTAILAARAQELGIEISDDAVLQFLGRYTQGTISGEEFARILNTVSQGRMTQNQFFAAMRRELMALRFLSLFQRGMLPPTPAAAWDYFQRLNRRATFEAVPFATDDYLAKVDAPSESEIVALYEEGKERYPIPSSPEPGFKRLKKVAIQYAKGDLNQFMDEAKAQISDAQVAEYYETNKEEFRNIELPDFGNDEPTADSDAILEGLLNPTNGAPGESTGEIDSPDTDSPDTDTRENAESPQLDIDLDGLDGPTGQVDPADQSQHRPVPTITLPVAQVETATDAADETDSAIETPDEAGSDAAQPPVDAPEDPLSALPDDPLADLPEAADEEPKRPEFKPLEEVEEDIRIRLATPIARQAMDDAINAVRSRVKSYYSDLRSWELSVDRESKTEPTPPDFRPIAEAAGLSFGQIPLVTVFEMMKDDPVTNDPLYEISRAYDTTPTYIPFYQRAFEEDLRRFDPKTIRGQVIDTEFVYWKTQEEAERIPELDEVRDEVVRALKRDKALELARQDAERVAKELQESGQRPSDKFRNDANRKVITADSVSWMTSTSIPGMPPRLTPLEGIPYAGDNFMKSVFKLEPNETGVAIDEPRETAYAVAMVSESPDPETLRSAFMRTFAQSPANETLYLAQRENQTYLQEWYQSIEDDLGLKWERDPTSER